MRPESLDLQARYSRVCEQIRAAAVAVGRKPNEIQLLAVSKGHDVEAIRALYDLGQRDFGENYAQELGLKARALAGLPLRWHFIGRLQSNKLPRIVDVTTVIHTVESFKHAEAIARRVGSTPFPIYLAVNAGAEAQKTGLAFDEVLRLAKTVTTQLPELSLQGIMAIPPAVYQDEDGSAILPPPYAALKQLAPEVGLGKLSLGMSGDLRLAIAAGSTCVRIGRALFGERPPRK